MVRVLNPPDVVKPASNYAQAVTHYSVATRMVVSGQLGLRPDGTLEKGLEAQMERAWANVLACLNAGGFETRHLVKSTVYVTEPGQVGLHRRVRDKMMDGHVCASTYLQIAGLAAPEFLVEIEAEAVKD